ncbi:BBE domain-containing protein [Mycobacterium tuberculosis]|uniref:BBE domain-containing protein n=3 Tax=Mycobacterium tuberculosis TaxID=1773 RepID=UPI001F45D075|nr:BBE domain-containing protein [Mycobacterium tuberculosis]
MDLVRYLAGGHTTYPPEGFVAGSDVIGTTNPAAAQAIVAAIGTWPPAAGRASALIDSLGGAVGDMDPEGSAFPWCRQSAVVQWYVNTPSDGQVATANKWLSDAHHAVQHFSVGGYVNYLEANAAASQYFGANLSRLTTVRRKYDPDRIMYSGLDFSTRQVAERLLPALGFRVRFGVLVIRCALCTDTVKRLGNFAQPYVVALKSERRSDPRTGWGHGFAGAAGSAHAAAVSMLADSASSRSVRADDALPLAGLDRAYVHFAAASVQSAPSTRDYRGIVLGPLAMRAKLSGRRHVMWGVSVGIGVGLGRGMGDGVSGVATGNQLRADVFGCGVEPVAGGGRGVGWAG